MQLATLKLDHAGLGDQGCAHIAHALQANTSLRTLDLSSNSAASDTGMVLSATLKVQAVSAARCTCTRPSCAGGLCDVRARMCVCVHSWLAGSLPAVAEPAGISNG